MELLDILFGEKDPPRGSFSGLFSVDAARPEPLVDRAGVDTDGLRGPADRVRPIFPPRRQCPVRLRRTESEPSAKEPDRVVIEGSLLGCQQSFGVECLGDLVIQLPFGMQLSDTLVDPLGLRMFGVRANAPAIPVFGSSARLPNDFEPDFPWLPFLIHGYLLDYIPEDLLALRCRGGGRVPDFGEIYSQREDVLAVRPGEPAVSG